MNRCDSCRRIRNLCDRLRRAGKPTNLRFRPCASCRETANAERRVSGPRPRRSKALGVDEQMVYRLLGGPDGAATRMERAEAMRQLLRVNPPLTRAQIAERVGVSVRTVERHAKLARSL